MTKQLYCSTCNTLFSKWEGYIDQDQDRGFGYCFKCQAQNDRDAFEFYEAAIEKLSKGLNPKNQKIFESYAYEMKRLVVDKAFDEGVMSLKIESIH